MMENHSEDKAKRILAIYTRLMQGKIVYKAAMSETHGVSQRTIQRDISDIQCFLAELRTETGSIQEVIYDKQMGGYLLHNTQNHNLSEKVVLAVCRILLGSRALVKEELFPIIQNLVRLCSDDAKVSIVENLLQDEMCLYEDPWHGRRLIDQLWKLEQAVKAQRYIKIRYKDQIQDVQVVQKLKPMRAMFLDCNFYLIAYPADMDEANDAESSIQQEISPVIYQMDKIQEYIILEEEFASGRLTTVIANLKNGNG